MPPLRPLLSEKNDFIWTADHDAAFEAMKKTFFKLPVLDHFDLKLDTSIQKDACRKNDMGYALLQRYGE